MKIDQKAPLFDHCKVFEASFANFPRLFRRILFNRYLSHKLKNKYDLSISLSRTSPQEFTVCGGTHKGYIKLFKKEKDFRDRLEINREQISYSRAKGVVAHSKMLANEIMELYGIPSHKVHLIYPPINTEIFRSSLKDRREELAKKWGINTQKTTLLFPSMGHDRKGWFELADAMSLLQQDPDIELIVAGNPINLNSSNIRSVGFVSNMSELYAAVDFTILPSHYEPFGLVVAESLQCRTPVIISRHTGALELCNEDERILIESVTPTGIVEAIKKAKKGDFSIKPNFAVRNKLTISEHIAKLKALRDL